MTSSQIPTIRISGPPNNSPTSSCDLVEQVARQEEAVRRGKPTPNTAKRANEKPKKTAMPPMRGFGRVVHAPFVAAAVDDARRTASRTIRGVASALAVAAMRNATPYPTLAVERVRVHVADASSARIRRGRRRLPQGGRLRPVGVGLLVDDLVTPALMRSFDAVDARLMRAVRRRVWTLTPCSAPCTTAFASACVARWQCSWTSDAADVGTVRRRRRGAPL